MKTNRADSLSHAHSGGGSLPYSAATSCAESARGSVLPMLSIGCTLLGSGTSVAAADVPPLQPEPKSPSSPAPSVNRERLGGAASSARFVLGRKLRYVSSVECVCHVLEVRFVLGGAMVHAANSCGMMRVVRCTGTRCMLPCCYAFRVGPQLRFGTSFRHAAPLLRECMHLPTDAARLRRRWPVHKAVWLPAGRAEQRHTWSCARLASAKPWNATPRRVAPNNHTGRPTQQGRLTPWRAEQLP